MQVTITVEGAPQATPVGYESKMFPGSRVYTIGQCIRNFGAARYLACLRARRQAGLYTEAEFGSLSARAYLENGQPRRALTLLQSPASAMLQNPNLLAEAETLAATTPCVCTLNMIVKNEAVNIGRALDSVDDCVDEIVICDTGSSDATEAIALRYGATVLHEPWADDFSKPRNTALSASRGAWIFWMDADDVFEPSSKPAFLSLIRENQPHAAMLCVDNVHKGSRGMQFLQVRLFPKLPTVAFERKVHEQISPSLVRLSVAHRQYPDIRVVHCGYDNEELHKKKALRNRPLIEEELKSAPDSPAILLSLGDCLSVLEKKEEALSVYQKIIASSLARITHPDMYAQAAFNIALVYKKTDDIAGARTWFLKTLDLDPSRSEALYLLGLMARDQGKAEEAVSYFLSCSRIKPPVRRTATDALKIRIDSVLNVAKYLFQHDALDDCSTILKAALSEYPNVVDFHSLYGKLLLCKGSLPDAARHFVTALTLSRNSNPDAAWGMSTIYLLLLDRRKASEYKLIAERATNPDVAIERNLAA
jgi:tetratricopeptide (TPR) repeat protein